MKNLPLAYQSLRGLAIGDAFGENFWGDEAQINAHISQRYVPTDISNWEFTDDTVMSIAIYKVLERYGEIRQDVLARLFAENYRQDIHRGYGGTAHYILRTIGEGKDWRTVSYEVFEGQGSMGNGGAMRAAPLGAYFYDDLPTCLEQARLSAEVTHAHPEGKVGAMAVAVASALALQGGKVGKEFLQAIADLLPNSDTTSKIRASIALPASYQINTITNILGNGTKLLATDTVPFALWCVAHHLDNFEEALWIAISALGDRDTICAIVGSIVALSAPSTVPANWQQSVEDLHKSIFWSTPL
jgi:ADP-ribosylglycohydrolase